MPQCKIIGATSSEAEIFQGKTHTNSCVISIAVFENTRIRTLLLKNNEGDFEKGQSIVNKLISKDTRAIISFR